MNIIFTEYMLPFGKRKEVILQCDDEYDHIVNEILVKGWRFECETLRTNQHSLTITSDEKDEFICLIPRKTNDFIPYVNKLLQLYKDAKP